MSRTLKQIRYIGTNTSYNSAGITNVNSLTNSTNFLTGGEKAIQIGVQAPENTGFKINNGTKIVIGRTNVFEWSVENTGDYIHSFQFLEGSNSPNDSKPLDSTKNYIVDFYLESETGEAESIDVSGE